VVEHAIEELGLEPDSLSAVRSDPAVAAYMQGLLFPGAAPHK